MFKTKPATIYTCLCWKRWKKRTFLINFWAKCHFCLTATRTLDASLLRCQIWHSLVQCAGVLMKKIFASFVSWLTIESENGWMKLWNLEWTWNNVAGKKNLLLFWKWNKRLWHQKKNVRISKALSMCLPKMLQFICYNKWPIYAEFPLELHWAAFMITTFFCRNITIWYFWMY